MRDLKKLLLLLLFGGIAVVAVWLTFSDRYEETNGAFGVYLLDDGLVISDDDIVSYNKTSHTIRLTQEGIERIKTLDLIRNRFAVKLNGRTIYRGSFWSDILSSTSDEVVITDILAIQKGLTDTARIEKCYPPSLCVALDPRDNPEILEHFQRIGKLI